MKEMKLRVGEGKLLKQLAMQIFNGEATLAPPRALRPPLLRDLFDASGKQCVFPEQHARPFTCYNCCCSSDCAMVFTADFSSLKLQHAVNGCYLTHLKGASTGVAVAATASKLFGAPVHALQSGSCRTCTTVNWGFTCVQMPFPA